MPDETPSEHEAAVNMAAESVMMIETAMIAIRSYFSMYHLWSARHHVALAQRIEAEASGTTPSIPEQHRVYVITAVYEAVAFMEAAVNELFADAAEGNPVFLGGVNHLQKNAMKAFWMSTDSGNVNLLNKYDAALTLNGLTTFDHGAEPYQSAKLVVQLRNWLTHYRPESLSEIAPHNLESRLKGRFANNALMTGAGNTWFPDHALGAGCAKWACSSAVALVDALTKSLDVKLSYQNAHWEQQPEDLSSLF